MDYFYTALVRDDGAIEFAEHYEDKSVAQDRQKQLAMEIICRAGDGHKYLAYGGPVSYEGQQASANAQIAAQKSGETDEAKIFAAGNTAASKAKTVSVLTAPPVDDLTEENAAASRTALLTAQLADDTLDIGTKIAATRELYGDEAAAKLYEETKEASSA
jgi:hypothetical protein